MGPIQLPLRPTWACQKLQGVFDESPDSCGGKPSKHHGLGSFSSPKGSQWGKRGQVKAAASCPFSEVRHTIARDNVCVSAVHFRNVESTYMFSLTGRKPEAWKTACKYFSRRNSKENVVSRPIIPCSASVLSVAKGLWVLPVFFRSTPLSMNSPEGPEGAWLSAQIHLELSSSSSQPAVIYVVCKILYTSCENAGRWEQTLLDEVHCISRRGTQDKYVAPLQGNVQLSCPPGSKGKTQLCAEVFAESLVRWGRKSSQM